MAIDEGKELDRRLGLGAGSAFLGRLGVTLSDAIRSQPTEIRSEVDVVARYEDLFLFSFPNTDFNDATVPMRRIIDITRREAVRTVGDNGFNVAIICGVLTWEPASGPIVPADFVYRTIEALYQAKKDGGNKLQHFRLGFKNEDPERLRIKHNQTAPLRLKTRPIVSGLLAAGPTEDAAFPSQKAPDDPAKKKRSKKTKPSSKEGKKKKKNPFWKLW
jgi:GGDEF domain-containing protein